LWYGSRRVTSPKIDFDKQLSDALCKVLSYNALYYLAYRLRLPIFPGAADLSYSDFVGIVTTDDIALSNLKQQLEAKWFTNRTVRLRRCFGRYFGGNHFFEVLVNKHVEPELGIKSEQLVALFHTGCQGLEAMIPTGLREEYLYQPTYKSTVAGEHMYEAFFTAQGVLNRYVKAYREATKMLIDIALCEVGLGPSTSISSKSICLP
jgi:hypothetical protein